MRPGYVCQRNCPRPSEEGSIQTEAIHRIDDAGVRSGVHITEMNPFRRRNIWEKQREFVDEVAEGLGVVPGESPPLNKDPRRTFEAAVKESGSQLPVSRHPTHFCQSASHGWSRSPYSSGTDGAQDCCHDDPIFPPCSFPPERSD